MVNLELTPNHAEEDGPDADTSISSGGPKLPPPCEAALEAAMGDDDDDDD